MVSPQTDTTSLTLSTWVTNVGSERVVAAGTAALINEAGVLVGRMPVDAQRLMPGERVQFHAEYPAALLPGRYRAILSLEYEEKVMSSAAEIIVPTVPGSRRAADRGDGPQR